MTKVGRNDPCLCGSGKKHKKCCLAKVSPVIDLTWQKMRRTEGELVPLLMDYAVNRFGSSVITEAWDEFNNFQEIELPEGETPLEFETIFLPWFLFNWVAEEIIEPDTELIMKPIAVLYLEEKAHRLDSFQKRYIKSICAEQFSFFVVTDVIPGQSLVLKDLIINRTVSVHERQGSESIRVGCILFSRIMTMNESSVMVGCAPIVIPADYHAYFIDLHEDWQSAYKELAHDILLEFEDEIRQIYHEINEQLNNQRPPQLHNTDGDPLEFVQLHYQLSCSPKEAFEALQSLAIAINEDELLEDGEFDNQDNLKSIKVPWMEKTGAEKIDGQRTVKGHLSISTNKLIIDVNSQKRAEAVKRKISRRLGKRATFKTSVIQSTDKMMEDAQESGSHQHTRIPNELESKPEVQAMLKEMGLKHWQNWLDMPLPALKDETPRQSAKTKIGRERLEALLLQFEGMSSDNANEPLDPDIEFLRNELGMRL
jgi:hypothetical protein